MAMMSMRGPSGIATMMGVGAGLMYFLDPHAGRRRRALMRDQVTHSVHATRDALDSRGRDLRNRATGISARVRRLFEGAQRHTAFTRAEDEGRAPAL
jgi:hypothetical protein